jgi:hypothetical protein
MQIQTIAMSIISLTGGVIIFMKGFSVLNIAGKKRDGILFIVAAICAMLWGVLVALIRVFEVIHSQAIINLHYLIAGTGIGIFLSLFIRREQ